MIGDGKMRIYMDACCMNRPFDDLSQERVYLEAEAILAIISRCENGEWTLLSSGTLDFELSRISDSEKYEKVLAIYSSANEHIKVTLELADRAKEFQKYGVKYFDSLHLALAESAEADVLLTTDDRLINAGKRTDAKVKILNPVTWLMEVMSNE